MSAAPTSSDQSEAARFETDALRDVERLRSELLEGAGALELPAAFVLRSRGKRLRPLLLLSFACLGVERPRPRRATLRAAAAVEILHEASLVHDDIVDGAVVRRGQPSVAEQFDVATACTLGAFMAGRALVALAESSDEAGASLDIEVVRRLSRGQLQEDLEPPTSHELQTRRLFEIVDGKTGALFAFATGLGASMAAFEGGHRAPSVVVEGVARHFAVAFQIRDDLADLEGDPHLRKPGGNDLVRSLPTWPFHVWAQRQEDPDAAWARLRESRGDLERARALQKDITDAGIAREVRARIDGELSAVSALLDDVPDGPARRTLLRVVDEVRP
jgi:geranylgeranyl pyrophosphate synthase